MARISGAPSIASDSAYSIPFSSQTMHTTRVYVDREEPMISGFGMTPLRVSVGDRMLEHGAEAAELPSLQVHIVVSQRDSWTSVSRSFGRTPRGLRCHTNVWKLV